MSLLFLKRVFANPVRVGYIVPSSPFLTNKTGKLLDLSKDRIVVELGPGEGCHTRRIARRMSAGSRLILIELDEQFAAHLRCQFAHDSRISVVQANALHLAETLEKLGVSEPDYIVSGLPFTIMDRNLRERLLDNIALCMGADSRFVIYQASTQISTHRLFDLVRRELCFLNVPPLHVMELRKSAQAAKPPHA
jgi:phospholipid N-methyltransferase